MKLAYLCVSYPVLSQTFILRETEALAALGIDLTVLSLLPAKGNLPCPAGVTLQPGSWSSVVPSLWRLPWECAKRPALAWRGLCHLLTSPPRTLEHLFHTAWGILFGFAFLARARQKQFEFYHAAWASMPATAAWILARFTDRAFSFGGHAYDIYRDGGDPLLKHKIHASAWIHTDAAFNRPHFEKVAQGPVPHLQVIRRGLNTFPPQLHSHTEHEPLKLLSVARLVEKKGHAQQIDACQRLAKAGHPFELRIAGDGPLAESLATRIREAGLEGQVHLMGACSHTQVQDLLQWANLFLHTGIIDTQGDRDGLPNVIPEAFSHGLAVISTPGEGACEAVTHEKTGLIVPATDPQALAEAICRLAQDHSLRQHLGLAARTWAEEEYAAPRNAARILTAIETTKSLVLKNRP